MEYIFLKVLAFKMAAPTTNQFLCLFMSIHSVCAVTESLALVSKINNSNTSQTMGIIFWLCFLCLQYVAELSLLEMDPFLQYTPSVVAAAAYSLATYTVNKSLWVCLFRSSSWISQGISQNMTQIWLNSSFYSLISYVPLRGIPWLIFCPASLSSTSCTSVQRLTHSSPSGKSTRAQSKGSFIVFHVSIETTVQTSHEKNNDFMWSFIFSWQFADCLCC